MRRAGWRERTEAAERTRIRRTLCDHGHYVSHLKSLLRGPLSRSAVVLLVAVSIGPDLDDPSVPLEEWAFIANMETSPLVVQAICDYAADHDSYGPILAWLGLRQIRLMGHDSRDVLARRGLLPTITVRRRWRARWYWLVGLGRWRIARAIMAVLAALAAVVVA